MISINKLPFIIGRSEKSDLCINNPSISKNHAIIQIDAEEDMNLINKEQNIILADNSLNGTYVNGTKIENGKKILLLHLIIFHITKLLKKRKKNLLINLNSKNKKKKKQNY